MTKLKVALLEDSKVLLKELKQLVEETGLAEVVAFATGSDEFFEKVRLQKPDAVFLDIDLAGDSLSGLDVANQLKLPVLFVSGKTQDNYLKIEELNINSSTPVEHLTKPISLDKLKKILPKFINEIQSIHLKQFVYLDFKGTKRNRIAVNDIVYVCADKNNGSESNNKVIYFLNREPETLIDFSFSKMHEKGFNPNQFITTHGSYRVNVNHILNYDKEQHCVKAMALNNGKLNEMAIPVSENYRSEVKSISK